MENLANQTHLAAQYLAAAGISFLPKKDDDSHTNLGFNTDGGYLSTHSLSDTNDRLLFNYETFSLQWESNQNKTTFRLDGATHDEVVKWLKKTSKNNIGKAYHFDLHYELPYKMNGTSHFKLLNVGELNDLMHLRILAQFICEKIVNAYKLQSDIRIWPHHFDTGIYSKLPDSDITIGLGLAIPDAICKEHYLYISGYKNGNTIETSGLPKLSLGEWKSDGFTGAILNTDGIVESDGVAFFKEAIDQLKTK